jgi:RNA polymerase sigma-70 factor, ECF subfamily
MIQPNSEHSLGSSENSAERIELADIVRRAERGDSAAQSELVRRYTRRLAGFIRSIIRQPESVEDVTQMVFIKMFRRLSRLRDPGVFESWLFTLARNTSLDFIRRRRCRPDTVTIEDEINTIPDPSDASAMTEILAALDRALLRLSPLDRTLVTQFVAGETYVDIANRTGLSLATVKVRLHRVRPYLRTTVGELTETRPRTASKWGTPASNRATITAWPIPSRTRTAAAA